MAAEPVGPYNEATMLAGNVDGVSPDEKIAVASLHAIKDFARMRPTVYLPTHDPQAGERLNNRQCVVVRGCIDTQT